MRAQQAFFAGRSAISPARRVDRPRAAGAACSGCGRGVLRATPAACSGPRPRRAQAAPAACSGPRPRRAQGHARGVLRLGRRRAGTGPRTGRADPGSTRS